VGQTPGISCRRRPGTRRHWNEQATILIGLIIVIAMLIIAVLPRIRRKL
jgi:hypothetical protein